MTDCADEQGTTPMIVNCVAYENGRRVGEIELDAIGQAVEAGQFVWVGLYEPSEELLKRLQEQLHLHDLAIEDAHRAHQRPKLEEYGDSLFLTLRTVQSEQDQIVFGETHVFSGKSYVATVRHGNCRPYVDVRARCERRPDILSDHGRDFILYALMDFVVDQYLPIAETLEDRLEALEERVFGADFERDTTARIYALKRDLVAVKHAISPLTEICHRLIRSEVGPIREEVQLHFRDVHDHVVRINQSVDNLRELLSAVLEANLSLISVQQNDVMKKLAAWAAIFAVPTMIAGVYGMNFQSIPGLGSTHGFAVSVLAMVSACGTLYTFFRKYGWL